MLNVMAIVENANQPPPNPAGIIKIRYAHVKDGVSAFASRLSRPVKRTADMET